MSTKQNSTGKKAIHYAWIILLAMTVIRSLSAAGINNTGGLFLGPVSGDLGVGVGSLSIYFSISSIATMFALPVAGKMIHKFGIKTMILVAAVLQTLSFMALGLMSNVWGWYILSVPMGIGGAILVNLVGPLLINRWFKTGAGTALGLMMACVGIFGAVIQPLVINSIAGMGWRGTYFLLGAAIAVIILVIAIFFIKNSPEEKGLEPYSTEKAAQTAKAAPEQTSIPQAKAMKSGAFWFLIIFMISITAFGAFSQHLATYGSSLGYSVSQMSTALSISMLGSTVGAIVIGMVSDKLGVLKATIGIIGVAVISILCLFAGGTSVAVFTAGGFLLGLAAMGIPVLAPLLTSAYFGKQDYESIYATVMMGPPFATVVLLPLYGFLFDMTGSYLAVIGIMGAFVLVGALCAIFGWKSKKKLAERQA